MTREEAIKRLKEYAQYSYGIWHDNEEDAKAFDMAVEALSAESVQGVGRYENAMQKLREMPRYLNGVKAKRWKTKALKAEPMTGEVREALMQLSMCAREECEICKYKDTCNFDFQYEESTKNMNTILDSLQKISQ